MKTMMDMMESPEKERCWKRWQMTGYSMSRRVRICYTFVEPKSAQKCALIVDMRNLIGSV